MSNMNQDQKTVLREIAGIDGPTQGAHNIRVDGKSVGRLSTRGIHIDSRKDGNDGLDITIDPGVKGEEVHIPVVISMDGQEEVVYNDFYIGADADVTIVAGCGIHNCGERRSKHDGIHTFHLGPRARVLYTEKHYGSGDGRGERIMNPVTVIHLQEDSYMEMDTVQIRGVDSTSRVTEADIAAGASLVIKEKLMTHGSQTAETTFNVDLNGEGCSANVISRSVAREQSNQVFYSKINGNNACAGHSECDAIIMDDALVRAVPEITANHVDAALIHEAAIGKIAGEQIVKLMTLGLSEEEAEAKIVDGFLK